VPFSDFKKVHTFRVHPREILFSVAYHLYITGGLFHDYTFLLQGSGIHEAFHNKRGVPFYWINGECGDSREDGWIEGESYLLVSPRPEMPEYRCILEMYDNFGTKPRETSGEDALLAACVLPDSVPAVASETITQIHERGGCAKLLISKCFEQPREDLVVIPTNACSNATEAGFRHLEIDGRTAPIPRTPGASPARMLFWLGRVGVTGHWAPLEASTILPAAIRSSRARRYRNPSNIFGLLDGNTSTCSWHANRDCRHFNSFLQENFRSLHERVPRAPEIVRAFQAASVKCAPTVILPGAQKGASTFAWGLIESHPLLLPAVRGKGFKETGVYADPRLVPPAALTGGNPADFLSSHAVTSHDKAFFDVVHAFPTIQEGEPFVTGDGTVTYMMNRGTPFQLRTDQPGLKIVFALRDPVERLWSDYRFLFQHREGKGPAHYFDNLAAAGDDILDHACEAGFLL